MKKQLRFLYRYIFTTGRWRRWINTHTIMAAFVSIVFVTTLSWNSPIPKENPHAKAGPEILAAANISSAAEAVRLQQTPEPTGPAAQPTSTSTPFPEEFFTNSDQTIGVTLAGAVLVMIVVVGVLSFLPKKEEE